MDYGLSELFWYGQSGCNHASGCQTDPWVTVEGWNQLLKYYATNARIKDNESIENELLWLYIPDYTDGGKMKEITTFTSGNYTWKQNENGCAGFKISDKDCEYRTKELEVVSYLPEECSSGEIPHCSRLVSYARFENRK